MKLSLARAILEIPNGSNIKWVHNLVMCYEEGSLLVHLILRPDGNLSTKVYRSASDDPHRDHNDGPARTMYDGDGLVLRVEYWSEGTLHRPIGIGPAVTSFDSKGAVASEQYWEHDNLLFTS
jgi:hypothetical protein